MEKTYNYTVTQGQKNTANSSGAEARSRLQKKFKLSLEMLAEAQLLMNHLADANRLQQLLLLPT